jgi:peptidoglycan/xylan/chitin deacetylase (PgdA/CDA1 family)
MALGTLARKAAKVAALPLSATRSRQNRLVVLLYHRVGTGTREIDLPINRFEHQLSRLQNTKSVIPLDAAVCARAPGVVITFDDGLKDFREHALPLLVRYQLPATLYLATGFVNGDGGADALSWPDLEEAVATGLVTVGSHTHSHADLSHADDVVADEEMRRSKELIEDRLGRPCRHFAFPWAVGSRAALQRAARLFDSVALDAWTTNYVDRVDFRRLGRTPVLRSDGGLFFEAKLRGLLDGEALFYRALRRGPWSKQ